MSLSRRQFLPSAGSEAAGYAWALLLARIHEVLPLPCPRGRVRSLPIHGRPRFAKHALDDGEKVKIAVIHPDFAEV